MYMRLDHMLFGCVFATKVWNRLADWRGITPTCWSRTKEVMINQCKSKTHIQKMYILLCTVAAYYIWKERNERRFQETRKEVRDVIKECQFVLATCCKKDGKLFRILRL